ncbi:thiol:disulfide interchange protein [Gemmobacter lanyuensis]|uniref:Thiol:disulfide interchange protein n=1 Tax=Gemmobacter lanyuensis TaxID=1054497 RepID=A0A918ILM8_9RHOB|nr:DsbE family thiol:disulfide interchange protein [Gemmobacter lanyuensis]GGW21645.1 thiol:disulfide interchange protein [Gemmobacter lanyuensis]
MNRILMFLPLVVVLGFLGAIALPKLVQNAEDPASAEALPSTLVGRPAPVLQVEPLGSHPALTDAALRAPGVKLVNFWASWCAPCRAEHPMLKQLQSEGIVIHGINYKDKPENAEAFLTELGNPYATLGTDAGRNALDWGVYGVPETYVIDGKGQVVTRFAGPITKQELERVIRPAIAQALAQGD